MIFDFDLDITPRGMKFFDRDTGERIARVCFADDERGIYARWWYSELPAGADDPSIPGEMRRPTRLNVYRAAIRTEYEGEAHRAACERWQPIIRRGSEKLRAIEGRASFDGPLRLTWYVKVVGTMAVAPAVASIGAGTLAPAWSPDDAAHWQEAR